MRRKRPQPVASLVRQSSKENQTKQQTGKILVQEKATTPEIYGRLCAAGIVLLLFGWSYFANLQYLWGVWSNQPDYSHGFLVLPFAVGLLWFRRDRMPDIYANGLFGGSILLIFSVIVRLIGDYFSWKFMTAYSILFWVGGIVWLFFGRAIFRWSLPSVLFLWFMIPLPGRVASSLSLPLQRIATNLSTWTLQLLGQPAISEGNTILINDTRLEVVDACSGLRVFIGIIALAVAYLLLVNASWWKKAVLVLGVVPISLIANATRIVVTAYLYQFESMDEHHQFVHDASGWMMIPFAALMFILLHWYTSRLFPEMEQVKLQPTLQIT